MQNICEFIMFSFTIGLFVAQWHDVGMQFGNNPTEWQNDDRECIDNSIPCQALEFS